ncbi:methyl-accepting chemotaxis protein [Aquabacter cavernae]|uniref:methyl-accepting chemotaxis protein n=1 Tax=Aquabacter cavernae TaxID=2496029 RepID=UPI000F8DE7B8|nr:methyl-accepting chemotaxis protein [Aquabacter cavernae]
MAFGTGTFRRDIVPPAIDTRLLDRLPSAVLLCDPQSFVIRYANGRSMRLLEGIAHVLPVKPDALIGNPLDTLHPAFREQREHILGATETAHRMAVTLNGETLEFHVDSIRDARGERGYLQLTWNVTTDFVAEEARVRHLRQMVDDMPINVMTCDPKDFRIDYANKATVETLRRIQHLLPITAEQLLGNTIDVFHQQPARWRELLADPRNLPHQARIRLGAESLDLRITAITNPDGSYAGPMLTWALVTDSVQVANGVSDVVGAMTRTSETVHSSSERLLALTQTSEDVASTVSASAVQMSNSFDEISGRLNEVLAMSQETADKAGSTDEIVNSLANSVKRIGAVTALIEKIASQTNLLALNATIEAARVGTAGKGFEVVAQEVKALAVQTADATKDIRAQVGAVQQASGEAAAAVSEITQNVTRLSSVVTSISSGMSVQSESNRAVSESIDGVSRASAEIREAAVGVSSVAGEVSEFAERLSGEIEPLLNPKG